MSELHEREEYWEERPNIIEDSQMKFEYYSQESQIQYNETKLKQNEFSNINKGNQNNLNKNKNENIPNKIIQKQNNAFHNDNSGIPQNFNVLII